MMLEYLVNNIRHLKLIIFKNQVKEIIIVCLDQEKYQKVKEVISIIVLLTEVIIKKM